MYLAREANPRDAGWPYLWFCVYQQQSHPCNQYLRTFPHLWRAATVLVVRVLIKMELMEWLDCMLKIWNTSSNLTSKCNPFQPSTTNFISWILQISYLENDMKLAFISWLVMEDFNQSMCCWKFEILHEWKTLSMYTPIPADQCCSNHQCFMIEFVESQFRQRKLLFIFLKCWAREKFRHNLNFLKRQQCPFVDIGILKVLQYEWNSVVR